MKAVFAALLAATILITPALALDTKVDASLASLRAFEEPLVPLDIPGTPAEDQVLAVALQSHLKRPSFEATSAITSFLNAYPQSRWRFALLANLGIIYHKTGHYSTAIDTWEQAWALGKDAKDYRAQALADRVASELATLLSSLGRTGRLRSLLAETKGRTTYGAAGAILQITKENLWLMDNKPGDSFKCGPYALDSIREFADKRNAHDPLIEAAQSSTNGFSLTQVRDLSVGLKMNYQMAKRVAGSTFIVPSVVHWKSGHYAALLKKQGASYLTQDPTFGHQVLLSEQALEDEASGYFLVPPGELPTGWQAVPDAEGSAIFGRGQVFNRNAGNTKPNDGKPGCPPSNGMAVYSMFTMLVSLNIMDTPVGYTPPVGPDVYFTVTYNQMEANQPSNFAFFNFGSSWNCSWLSYVTPPTSNGGTLYINTRGGGQETYASGTYTATSQYPGYVGYYGSELQSQAKIWVTSASPATYERRLPDGSKEVFGLVDSAGPIFLTVITDPQGNSLTLGYDINFRLTSVTDALGLQTTLTYGLSPNPIVPSNPLTYLVTKVTDPYNRYATFAYTSSAPYQLSTITDVIGIQSQFTYGSGSAITRMQTPYGTTTFTASNGNDTATVRSLKIIEPDGSQVYAESHIDGSNYPYGSTEPVPSGGGFSNYTGNQYLLYRNTYYWGKKAMQVTANNPTSDYKQAYIYHFLHTVQGQESGVLESEKPALENRIWYNYPGQTGTYIPPIYVGSSDKPTVVARVVTGKTTTATQATQNQYNNTANPAAVTSMIDPVGRQTNYVYDTATGIDLTSVTQKNGTNTDTLKTITYDNTHNPPHRPATVTDAAGQTTSYTYNSKGQVTVVAPPLRAGHMAEATTYGYTSNFLTSITRPLAGAISTIVLDTLNGHTINRPHSVSDPEGYTLTYSYDNLDRVTKTTYPDATAEKFVYTNLDLVDSFDRLNRNTHREYDATRHLTAITDPLSQKTQYGWCSCGSMTKLTDPKGNATTFNYDVESRLISKVYQDSTQTSYNYDLTTSWLHTRTDARGNVATYAYNLDDTMSSVTYAVVNGTVPTPSDNYTYDPYYRRMLSANGVSFTYVPSGSAGAGRPFTVTNTLSGGSGSAVVNYLYDEWSRDVFHNIGSDSDGNNLETTVFDSLGRTTSTTNLLGLVGSNFIPFAYTYDDGSASTPGTFNLSGVTFPNGQHTAYGYFPAVQDERLQEIKHTTSTGALISQHDYTYDAVGKILTWQQQTGSNSPLLWTEGYDNADQLTSSVEINTAIPSPAVMQYSYSYDAAGNAYTTQVGTVSRVSTYNNLNQLKGSTATGSQTMQFTGPLNGATGVTINGSATSTNWTSFSGTVTAVPGSSSTVTVSAQDAQGNSRTNKYQVAIPAQPNFAPTYDVDGNELTDGAGQIYTWDAKSQLITINYTGGNQTTFTYDSFGQRIRIVEAGSLPSTKQFVWEGKRLVEERDASNHITKRFFAQGEQIQGTPYFYTRDHLGSVREMMDSSNAVHARYNYDLYGSRSPNVITVNPVEADFGFTGFYFHQPSGLHAALYRVYDTRIARWISRDPLRENGGVNLYAYVENNPLSNIDPLGLFTFPTDPSGLGPDWIPDPSHLNPNGGRFRNPKTGDYCDFHNGRPGKPGWRGKNHWHWNGNKKHYNPGDDTDEGGGDDDGGDDDGGSGGAPPPGVPIEGPGIPITPLTPRQQQQIEIGIVGGTAAAAAGYFLIIILL